MPFGLELCFDQKQLRRDQPLREHGQQTHARCGEGGCYGRRRIMQLGAELFDGEIQLGRDRAQICGVVKGAEFGASKADL